MIKIKLKPSLPLGSFSIRTYFLVAAITLLGLVLRVVQLDFQPLWWDEGYSVFFATRDLGTMLARTAVDIHPPLYYLLLSVWMDVFGKNAVMIRLFSVFVGVATIPLIYALAMRMFSQAVGWMAALLLAVSPIFVYYSQEVRMYGLVALLGILSIYLFVRLLEMPTGTLRTAFFVACYIGTTTAALYTEYYAIFILVLEIALVLSLAFGLKRPRIATESVVHWLGAWAGIALLYLPWIAYAGPKLYSYVTAKVAHEQYAPLDPITFLAQHLSAFSTGHLNQWTWLAWATIATCAIAVIGFITLRWRTKCAVGGDDGSTITVFVLLFYLFIPMALGYVVNLVYPFHPVRTERLLLLAAPAFYVLVAAGLLEIVRRLNVVGIGSLTVLLTVSALALYDFYTVARYPNDDYRSVIEQIRTNSRSGDGFLAVYPWQIGYLETYYSDNALKVVEVPSDTWVSNPDQMKRDLDTLRAQHPRVWLPAMQTLGRILEDSIDSYLRPRDYGILDTWFGTTRLELFAAQSDPPETKRKIAFGQSSPSPVAWGISEAPLVAGNDILQLWFDWGHEQKLDFKTSYRLLDSHGNVWAQDDRPIEPGRQRIGLLVPAGTPPGAYTLALVSYGNADSSPAQQEAVSLAPVTIASSLTPDLAAIPHRADATFANGMRLVGFADGDGRFKPGVTSGIALYWQPAHSISEDYAVSLELIDGNGRSYASTKAAPAHGIYPTSKWSQDEVVLDPEDLFIRGDAPDGSYHLVLSVYNPVTSAKFKTVDGRESIQITDVHVQGRVHYFGAPRLSHAFDARLGDVARLVGYDIVPDSGGVRLVVYWQALGPGSADSRTSYTVFVHALDSQGNLQGQSDHVPGNGAYPTTTFVKGEYLIDEFFIAVSSSEIAQFEIGMYDAATGARVAAFDGSDRPIGDHCIITMR